MGGEDNKKKKKKSSVKSMSGLDKRGLHSPGLQPNQTNKSIIQQPHPHAALQQTVRLPTRSSSAAFLCTAFPTSHGYQCVFHGGVQKLTARPPHTGHSNTAETPMQQQHNGLDAEKLKLSSSGLPLTIRPRSDTTQFLQ